MPDMQSSSVGSLFANVDRFRELTVLWLLMIVAMMTPLLILPMIHIYDQSLVLRRLRGIALFLLGYVGLWMLFGCCASWLLAVSSVGHLGWIGFGATFLIAVVWQISPFKQRCLNRCHNFPSLAAFGLRADAAALSFGLRHAGWCVGSCWLLMLMPMFIPAAGPAAMAFITLLMFSERLERPRTPVWQMRVPMKLWRSAVAQLGPSINARSAPVYGSR